MAQNTKASMYVYALLTVALWTTAYVYTRVAVEHYAPESISFLRYFIASFFMLVYARIKKIRLPAKRDLHWFILAGASGFGVYMYVFNTGAQTVSAAVTSFIICASPVITALFARIFLREHIGARGWLSVAVSFAGVGIITLYDGNFSLSMGVLWICAAALLVSMYNIFQRILLKRYTPLEVTAYAIFFGTLMLLPFIPQSLRDLKSASPAQIATIIYLGIFPSALAYFFWATALSKTNNTSEVTNFMFLTPLTTTLMGFFVIKETPEPQTLLGGALILAGVLIMRLGKKAHEKRF